MARGRVAGHTASVRAWAEAEPEHLAEGARTKCTDQGVRICQIGKDHVGACVVEFIG